MKAQCYVSGADYRALWQGLPPIHVSSQTMVITGYPVDAIYVGPERRRSGLQDRRTQNHDRRWEGSRGRRFRLADRRQG